MLCKEYTSIYTTGPNEYLKYANTNYGPPYVDVKGKRQLIENDSNGETYASSTSVHTHGTVFFYFHFWPIVLFATPF